MGAQGVCGAGEKIDEMSITITPKPPFPTAEHHVEEWAMYHLNLNEGININNPLYGHEFDYELSID
jgi:hypothetical protein